MKVNRAYPNMIYRIRNTITGQYLHITLFRILEFNSIYDACKYLKAHELNERIYMIERIK